VKCVDGSSNANTTDYEISFDIVNVIDATAPILSNGLPL